MPKRTPRTHLKHHTMRSYLKLFFNLLSEDQALLWSFSCTLSLVRLESSVRLPDHIWRCLPVYLSGLSSLPATHSLRENSPHRSEASAWMLAFIQCQEDQRYTWMSASLSPFLCCLCQWRRACQWDTLPLESFEPILCEFVQWNQG